MKMDFSNEKKEPIHFVAALFLCCFFTLLFSFEAGATSLGYLKNIGLVGNFSSTSYNSVYNDVDFQVKMKRSLAGDPANANCIFIRGTVNPLGTLNRWNSYYGFF